MRGRVRRRRWIQIIVTVVAVVIYAVAWWQEQGNLDQPGLPRPTGTLTPGEYDVLRVVDGDTLLLKHKHTRARLQGIDTPETVKENTPVEAWGPEASAYTKQFVAAAHGRVRLEIDGESVDQYGRNLVFVWHDGRLLNEELVREGLARAKLAYDYSDRMKDRLRGAQDDARASGRGIWSR